MRSRMAAALPGDDHPAAARVLVECLSLHEAFPLQPVDQAGQVVLGKQRAGLDLEGAQTAAFGLHELPQHVVPAKRRQARRLEVPFDG